VDVAIGAAPRSVKYDPRLHVIDTSGIDAFLGLERGS
jgi:hypothetical protein